MLYCSNYVRIVQDISISAYSIFYITDTNDFISILKEMDSNNELDSDGKKSLEILEKRPNIHETQEEKFLQITIYVIIL